ncbi:MAG: GNAT family N-acetyltransferase [Candidatus Cryosericum sp.]
MDNFNIRQAVAEDNHQIFTFIKELADYEKISREYIVTEEVLFDSLFVKKSAEVLIGEVNGTPIGYALFFANFPTSMGKAGIYIEDVFIEPEYRGHGYGRQFFTCIAAIAAGRNCSRIEWICLDWNEPARKFYESLGAVPREGWLIYRLGEDRIRQLAQD